MRDQNKTLSQDVSAKIMKEKVENWTSNTPQKTAGPKESKSSAKENGSMGKTSQQIWKAVSREDNCTVYYNEESDRWIVMDYEGSVIQ
eukprot:CAMPEP_0167744252 /NCGR_PEP_ID=MMETSP0110_2-20121227/2484_1 /TAXON_ID=629695 /ORGANISM="Gymnochlora sp., Strain CCMP2014" /LENGTH=87 /DNA_ID=CAMNT_0007628745 /DNA_START=83 /DNA_END=346 /DNA_ORIENTATION=+